MRGDGVVYRQNRSLREITEDNRAAVEALAVTEAQSHYVDSITPPFQRAGYETLPSTSSTSTPPPPLPPLDLYPV